MLTRYILPPLQQSRKVSSAMNLWLGLGCNANVVHRMPGRNVRTR